MGAEAEQSSCYEQQPACVQLAKCSSSICRGSREWASVQFLLRAGSAPAVGVSELPAVQQVGCQHVEIEDRLLEPWRRQVTGSVKFAAGGDCHGLEEGRPGEGRREPGYEFPRLTAVVWQKRSTCRRTSEEAAYLRRQAHIMSQKRLEASALQSKAGLGKAEAHLGMYRFSTSTHFATTAKLQRSASARDIRYAQQAYSGKLAGCAT